jgi:hypothetical protein
MRFSTKIPVLLFAMLLSIFWSGSSVAQQSLIFPSAHSGDYQTTGMGVINGVVATTFQNDVYTAFEASNADGYQCGWTNGSTTSPCLCTSIPGQAIVGQEWVWNCPGYLPAMDGQPQITVWNGIVYVAFAEAGSHQLAVASSSNGYYFSYVEPAGITVAPGPAIGVFNGQLYVAYQQNASAHYLGIASSYDGVHFSNSLHTNIQIGHSPAITQFQNKLVVANFCQCDSHYLDVYTSVDGVSFSKTEITSQVLSNISAPSLLAYNNVLALAYVRNNTNDIYTSTSYDAVNWTTPVRQSNTLSFSLGGSSLATVNSNIYIVYESERALSYDPDSTSHQEYYSVAGGIQ